jgi:hypothetical protein
VINRAYVLKPVFFFALLLIMVDLHAQIVEADTLVAVEQSDVQEAGKVEHSPRKATIYSAVLPGLGQAYNKKYWKIPLVYAGFGAIGYFIKWNNDNYQLFRIGYIHLTDTIPETQDYLKIEAVRRNNYDLENPNQFNNLKTALSRQQDYYRRNRDLLIISMVAFYGLNIIDASVDAHLFDFDISDDLSLNWQPSMMLRNNNLMYCVNFKLNF